MVPGPGEGREGDELGGHAGRRRDGADAALVLSAGFARTIQQARQLVVHRHILVDGKRVDVPSFRVKEGQMIHVHERSEKMVPFQLAAAGAHQQVLPATPGYLTVEIERAKEGTPRWQSSS